MFFLKEDTAFQEVIRVRKKNGALQNFTMSITKTCLFKHTENFTNKKWKFSDKNSDIFHISAQNIDSCGTRYNRLGDAVLTSTHNLCFWAEIRKIMYTPVNPVLLYIYISGVEGVKII